MIGLHEDLLEAFNDDLLSIADPGPLKFAPTSATVSRSKKLDLELTLTSSGRSRDQEPDIPAGTLYQAQDQITFSSPSGEVYTAQGVIYRNHSMRSSTLETQNTYKFSIHALEKQVHSTKQPAAIIEWVGNLSKWFFGNARVVVDDKDTSIVTIGDSDQPITIKRSAACHESSNIIQLMVDGLAVYLVHFRNKSEEENNFRDGYIAYKGNPDSNERQKIRECISFVLGLPIILYGYTAYSEAGHPLSKQSFSAYAFGGKVFELPDQPPYPVNLSTSKNMIDGNRFSNTVEALYRHYDDLNFLSLSWTYWHGVCTSYSMSAVYFGALIEQLQRVARKLVASDEGGLLEQNKWKALKAQLMDLLEPMEVDPTVKTILRNKLFGLNQVPQSVALDRLLQRLGLEISEAEKLAWKHRNNAAHGNSTTDHDEVILNNKILRLMFHRLLAAITECNDQYIDYYNLGFPVRAVKDGVPARQPIP